MDMAKSRPLAEVALRPSASGCRIKQGRHTIDITAKADTRYVPCSRGDARCHAHMPLVNNASRMNSIYTTTITSFEVMLPG